MVTKATVNWLFPLLLSPPRRMVSEPGQSKMFPHHTACTRTFSLWQEYTRNMLKTKNLAIKNWEFSDNDRPPSQLERQDVKGSTSLPRSQATSATTSSLMPLPGQSIARVPTLFEAVLTTLALQVTGSIFSNCPRYFNVLHFNWMRLNIFRYVYRKFMYT